MTVVNWPSSLRPNHSMIPMLERNTASAGVSISGQERLVATDAGRWRYGFRVPVRNRQQVLAWRALVAQAEGRSNLIRVPICDSQYDPARDVRSAIARTYPAGIPYSSGTFHSSGMGFAISLVNATVASFAGIGATSITLAMIGDYVPEPGHFFGDGDRLYQVKTATLTTGTTYALTFLPRLRDPMFANDAVRFDRLSCLMRFASDDMLEVEQELRRFSELNVQFVEALS